jgi:hypothetical protein
MGLDSRILVAIYFDMHGHTGNYWAVVANEGIAPAELEPFTNRTLTFSFNHTIITSRTSVGSVLSMELNGASTDEVGT